MKKRVRSVIPAAAMATILAIAAGAPAAHAAAKKGTKALPQTSTSTNKLRSTRTGPKPLQPGAKQSLSPQPLPPKVQQSGQGVR